MNVSCWCIVQSSWFVHAAGTNVVNAYVCRVCIRSYPRQQINHQRKWTLGLTVFHLTIDFNHTYAYPHTLALYATVKKREMTFKLNTEHFSKRAGRKEWQKHEMGRDGAVFLMVQCTCTWTTGTNKTFDQKWASSLWHHHLLHGYKIISYQNTHSHETFQSVFIVGLKRIF